MLKILVIDDDALDRERVVATLTLKGYQAAGVPDGAAGLVYLREDVPDLVLCDVNMPQMDGYTVLEHLREDTRTVDLPFIFMTARTERDDLRQGMALGADDYLTKPFTNDELLEAVTTQLAKRRTIAQKYEDTIELLRKNIVYALPHELRTPLTGSIGFAEVLHMDADTLAPEQIREIAERIIRHNKRLHRVLENFLVYAQIEVVASDPEQLEQVRNHITAHVGDVIELEALHRAHAHGRADDLRLDVEDIALRIAENDLVKIINELVDNAFKFSKPGTAVEVCGMRDSDMYIISVRDRGRGLSASQIAAVGAYMQFDRMLYEQQGLGMGLVITSRLADLHDGRMAIHSEPGTGTEVRIAIPMYGQAD